MRTFIRSIAISAAIFSAVFAYAAGDESAKLRSIFPDAAGFEKRSIDGIDYYAASGSSGLCGYGVLVTADGYSGPIKILAGVNPDGIVQGIAILDHCETPGFGAKINEICQMENEPRFLRQFKGKPASGLEVGKNIDAVTGATISSRIVTDAVKKTVSDFLAKIKK